jgi:MarR family transcriptional regulator, temperature-dependent positive regulator of motility
VARDPVGRMLAAYPVIHQACRQRDLPAPEGGARVSAHQASVLAQLESGEGITLTELAGRMGTALPTMSLLVDRLARAGLLARDRDPEDGRRVLIRLTAPGERVVSSRSLLDPERVRALLATLTPAERARSVDGLATLARAARRLSSTATEREPSSERGRE